MPKSLRSWLYLILSAAILYAAVLIVWYAFLLWPLKEAFDTIFPR